jgi:hypothetical protein
MVFTVFPSLPSAYDITPLGIEPFDQGFGAAGLTAEFLRCSLAAVFAISGAWV